MDVLKILVVKVRHVLLRWIVWHVHGRCNVVYFSFLRILELIIEGGPVILIIFKRIPYWLFWLMRPNVWSKRVFIHDHSSCELFLGHEIRVSFLFVCVLFRHWWFDMQKILIFNNSMLWLKLTFQYRMENMRWSERSPFGACRLRNSRQVVLGRGIDLSCVLSNIKILYMLVQIGLHYGGANVFYVYFLRPFQKLVFFFRQNIRLFKVTMDIRRKSIKCWWTLRPKRMIIRDFFQGGMLPDYIVSDLLIFRSFAIVVQFHFNL